MQGHHTPLHLRALLFALFILLFSHAVLTQEVYRWQDEAGKTQYSDTPPSHLNSPQPLTLYSGRALYVVEKVVDGDTIIVKGGGRVRLLGINTPEIAHRQHAAEPLGDRAHQRLEQLLRDKKVYLEFDQQRRDRFKRLLAHITLEDGSNINEQLLREGLARALFLQPNMKHLQDYFRIEAVAQKEKRGLWALPEFQIRPANKAQQCIKHFCRLRGKVRRVETKQQYTYLQLAGELQVAIHNQRLPQLLNAGIHPAALKGKTIIVRGWIGQRKGKPIINIQHNLQIQLLTP